jgi:hypothetical protein
MQSDYATTGKIYKAINAYTLGNCCQQMPDPHKWYYFGTTRQFKTCKGFVEFLEWKYPNHKFKASLCK